MKTLFSSDIQNVIEAVHYRPSVSIIMPFEPKVNAKTELNQQFRIVVDNVKRELKKNYSEELTTLVVTKLKQVIAQLNFSTFRKSIALYVSPVFEKVLYLDIPVRQKIVIDGSFRVRDLLEARKDLHEYMVLVLSGKCSKVYVGNYDAFTRVKANIPDNIAAFKNDIPEKVSNFSDTSSRREVLLDKFLHHTDEGLRFLLQVYTLPVFVMGTKRVLGHFKAITRNDKSIVCYILGNYEDASDAELARALKPNLDDWKKVRMKYLVQLVQKSAGKGKLAVGIKKVWENASQRRGRLLIIEKDFAPDTDEQKTGCLSSPASTKDAVDIVIEKVLEQGGDVEFVDKGMLGEFDHIALIQYY